MRAPFWKVILCTKDDSGETIETIECFADKQEAKNHAKALGLMNTRSLVKLQRVSAPVSSALFDRGKADGNRTSWLTQPSSYARTSSR
jgi:hypothetical protein